LSPRLRLPATSVRRPLTHRVALALALLLAGTAPGAGDLQDLLLLLDEQTRLATKSRMNADYVPGMATVLRGEELRIRGARTVWEALSLVPGISQGIEFTGERQSLSRGVGHGYASGNVKILLDGVSMNSSLLATANPVMNMPIEQVERVEVIRGPGSSVHGEYAYAGVVNVITRHHGRTLQLLGGTEQIGGGVIWEWRDAVRELAVSVNLMGVEGDGPQVQVRRDALYQTGQADLSNAPGPSNEAQRYRAAFLNLDWGDWFATARLLDDAYGDHFGINHFLPPPDHRLASRQRCLNLGLGRKLDLGDALGARLRLETLSHDRERQRLYVYPAGFLSREPVFMDLDYRERRYLASADLHWQPNPAHQWLFVLEASHTEIEHAGWRWYDLPFPITVGWIDTDLSRDIGALVAQDQFRVNEDVTLTATLRYDRYSDLGGYLSPRLAAVWRLDQENILKFQYASAFRPPTFYEIHYAGTGAIDPSGIRTFELGYILKKPAWEGRLILFHSALSDPITFDELDFNGYINDLDARLRGAELEYQQRLGSRIKLDANLSYVDAEVRATGDPLPGGARWLGNAALLWQPRPQWTVALQLRYVGERSRTAVDPRGPLPANTSVDLTVDYRAPGGGLIASLGINNLTDADLRYPDQLTTDLDGQFYLAYPDDYPRPGRRWWISLGYRF
jgi:outer membrane receptor for ferrienterochelin and colicins